MLLAWERAPKPGLMTAVVAVLLAGLAAAAGPPQNAARNAAPAAAKPRSRTASQTRAANPARISSQNRNTKENGNTAEAIPAIAEAPRIRLGVSKPLTTAQCLASLKIRCYTPMQYRAAYDLGPLYKRGVTGKGRTIVIIDSFGSPTIEYDLAVFDDMWHLPPPPEMNIIPTGSIPPFNLKNSRMLGWAQETTLDVEYAHAVAPGAAIDLVETPVAETEGIRGLPQMMQAERRLIDENAGDIISQSFGATENTFPGFAQHDYASLLGLRYAFQDAYARHITVLAASGDSGATGAELNDDALFPYRTDSWPSSDPLVTSVGGTELFLTAAGARSGPDQAWNDGFGASGGGVSAVFARPVFQNEVGPTVGDHRGTPDISMSAAVNGAAWVYASFIPQTASWQLFGGTSEATPLFAGIVALADQLAGRRLGDINTALYALGSENDPARTGIISVPQGNNSFGGIPGYQAGSGYDLVTGWGTIDAAKFVPALVGFDPIPLEILESLPAYQFP